MTKVRLVLCDDNSADLERLHELSEDYLKSRGLCGETVRFSDPGEVLRYSESGGEDITVYLFDVIMPNYDGIELGKKIRERDKNSAVIYMSVSREYSLDAFSVRAFSYLLKPISREKLFAELDECLSGAERAQSTLTIKTADSTALLALYDIIAVEYLNHRMIFHLANGKKVESTYRRQPFDVQAEELMQTGMFLKVSSSYLVNYHNVQGIKADEFIMRDGSQYKITRKYTGARQQYINGEMPEHKKA